MIEEDWDSLHGENVLEPHTQFSKPKLSRTTWKTVDNSPNRQMIVFALRHDRLLSLVETASALDCSADFVNAHLSRAIANLKDRLKKRRTSISHGGNT